VLGDSVRATALKMSRRQKRRQPAQAEKAAVRGPKRSRPDESTEVDIAAELAKLNQMVDQKLDGFQEQVRQDISGVNQRLDGFQEQVRQDISGVNQRLDQMEHRLDQVEHKMNQVDHRMNQLDKKLDGFYEQVRQDISGVNQRLDQMDRKMDGLRKQLKEDMCDVVAALKPVKGAKDTEAYKWLAQRYPSKEDYKEWISEKIEQQNQKIDQQNQAINQKIDQQNQAINQKMDQQNQAINQKMDQQNQKVDQMMRNMQEIFQRLQSTVA